jgi:alkanesulfonate monooxygenase SsuD/methylene tetrahydromethanopterin reductase-like flavin-dependent oxidoreductase (luciferase family)
VRIGMIAQLNGRPGGTEPAPTWERVRTMASTAEAVGFDAFVFEDALLYRGAKETNGCLESMSVAAALAVSTSRIEFGQSVVNAPYRSPALTAKMAVTIDDISGGRYILGIGAGNTADSDYEAFGFPKDKRYSRFAETIEIIRTLLETGEIDFEGDYYSAHNAELVLRGPRPGGPPINIAAGGPKMMRLAARHGAAWNWWFYDHRTAVETLTPLVEELERACDEVGRDPATLTRTLDAYMIDPMNRAQADDATGIGTPLSGTVDEIAETLLGFDTLGFGEIRCDLYPKTVEAIEAMAGVVERVHAG